MKARPLPLIFIGIKKIVREYYKQLYAHVFDNLDEID